MDNPADVCSLFRKDVWSSDSCRMMHLNFKNFELKGLETGFAMGTAGKIIGSTSAPHDQVYKTGAFLFQPHQHLVPIPILQK